MNFKVTERYMQLPVSYADEKQWVEIRHGNEVVTQFEARLSSAPDYYSPVDLASYIGQEITIEANSLPDGFVFKETIRDISNHPLRPRIHFTSQYGWLNDPNGLFYFDGTYHLFYQHNPYGQDWGNMHWGHAISRDLLTFEELGDALFPDEEGTMFSGSAIVDFENRSGLKKGEHPPILLYYTSAGNFSPLSKDKPFTVRAAVSTDGGKVFYKCGPSLVPNMQLDDRDPKVVWVPELEAYVLAIYKGGPGSHKYALYRSDNLLDWKEFQAVELVPDAECPDLIELFVDGDPNQRRWVFWGASGYYRVGQFQYGQLKLSDTTHHNTIFEKEPILYAAQTYSNAPLQGEAIQFSWMRCPTENVPFSMQMSFPFILGLTKAGEEEVLTVRPADCALDGFAHQTRLQGATIEKVNALFERATIDAGVVKLSLSDAPFTLHIGEINVAYKDGEISTPFGNYPIDMKTAIDLAVVVDGDLLELFLQNGRLVLAGRPNMQRTGKKWRLNFADDLSIDAALYSLDEL